MEHQHGRTRVAIIGAGASGLTAIKCCLDEGLEPVCFEKEDVLGGLWHYTEEAKPGRPGIYSSCTINTSKEMMAFSDLPIPADFPPFMPHHYVLRYLRLYAGKFDLMRHIRFGICVESVRRSEDHVTTGRWEVVTRLSEDSQSSEVEVGVYDGVMVCSGHHVFPRCPVLPGLDEFRGLKLHSSEYRRPDSFTGKNVLVVGIGNSAVDIAVDLSRVASQVFLSTRRGAWVIGRVGPLGIPADVLANSRLAFTLPRAVLQWLVELLANYRFNHRNYGVLPRHRALEAHPTINDDLPLRMITGSIRVHPEVQQFDATGVTFTDGSHVHIDAVVFATGYRYLFEFMQDDVLSIIDNQVDLYRFVFPPHHEHPTLAMIGLVQAVGSVLPISEIQSRWFARVLKGLCNVPGRRQMEQHISHVQTKMRAQYIRTKRHTLETFFIEYMDSIAAEIGARPNLYRLFFTDPCLATRCFMGPCVPAQYRLQGPGAWAGAKTAICNAFSNNVIADSMNRPQLSDKQNKVSENNALFTVLLCVFIVVIIYQFCIPVY